MFAADPVFVSLADALRAHRQVPAIPTDTGDASEPPALPVLVRVAPSESAEPRIPSAETAGTADAIRAARLFRAAVGDAFDALVLDLVREIAIEIVARELRLADVDIATIARRLIAERFADEPLRVRVAPSDAGIACGLPIAVDMALEPGDAILECRSGSIDARLEVRLAALLDAVRP